MAAQRVLVEVDGAVSTRRLLTSHCRSVRQLRELIADECAELSGGAPSSRLLLEYLDEKAGLAITVSDRMSIRTVLARSTLKATFSAPPPSSRRRRRRRNEVVSAVDDDDDDDGGEAGGGSSCLLM